MNTNLIEYYRLRAAENESVYAKPERQADLAVLGQAVGDLARNADVLEIVCGTGYWTQIASQTARSILATDVNDTMLAVARAKPYQCPVTLQQADLYDLPPGRPYDLLLGAFIWSHLPLAQLPGLLARLLGHVRPGGRAVFFDNRYVEGNSTPLRRTDEHGNTYQLRTLPDGSTHEVLKNFPTPSRIAATLPENIEWHYQELSYYWILTIQGV